MNKRELWEKRKELRLEELKRRLDGAVSEQEMEAISKMVLTGDFANVMRKAVTLNVLLKEFGLAKKYQVWLDQYKKAQRLWRLAFDRAVT